MARFCRLCSRAFPTTRGFISHRRNVHRHPKPAPPPTVKHYHPDLDGAPVSHAACSKNSNLPSISARPCDEEGNFLPEGAPTPPKDDAVDFSPFADRPSFEFAELVFETMQVSKGNLDTLLRIIAAKNVADGHPEQPPIFDNAQEVHETIDDLPYGDATWRAYKVRYTGPIDPNSPSWMRHTYVVYMRDTLVVAKQLVGSDDFAGKYDARPFAEYLLDGTRTYCNLMSGQWAYKEAVSVPDSSRRHPLKHAHGCLRCT